MSVVPHTSRAAVGDAQRHGIGGPAQPSLEVGDARVEVGRLVRDERLPVARVAGQVVGQRLGGAEHAEEPVAQRLGAQDGTQQLPAVVALRLGEPDEPAQRQVGVGGGAERVEEDRVAAHGGQHGQFEEPLGGGRIGEAVPQQSGEGTAPAPRPGHVAPF
jgi:hypothetical protein